MQVRLWHLTYLTFFPFYVMLFSRFILLLHCQNTELGLFIAPKVRCFLLSAMFVFPLVHAVHTQIGRTVQKYR